LIKLFVLGVILGLAAAAGLAYSVPVVDLHREASHITVRANGGNVESFRINLPRDRIMVGLAGADTALPAGLDWPDANLLGDLQAEMFKVRDRNNAVIGVASRLASASEATGSFIEWTVHLPARGTVYMQMDLRPTAAGFRNGRLTAGTGEFEKLTGNVREQLISGDADEDGDSAGRIELETAFIGPLGGEPELAAASGGQR
jgi:hypothetical protein